MNEFFAGLRTTSAFDDKCGKTITCNLKFPKLSFGAVPSIFPNCPAYLSQSSFTKRNSRKNFYGLISNSISKVYQEEAFCIHLKNLLILY